MKNIILMKILDNFREDDKARRISIFKSAGFFSVGQGSGSPFRMIAIFKINNRLDDFGVNWFPGPKSWLSNRKLVHLQSVNRERF